MASTIQKGIVTRSNDYRDTDRIINLFTSEGEIITAAIFGSKSTKDQKAVASQIFAYGEYVIESKLNKSSVSSCSIIETYRPITSNYARYTTGCMMVSSINTAMSESENNPEVFLLLQHCLTYLAYSELHQDDLLIYFLLNLMSFIGFCPSITECTCCGIDITMQSMARFDYEQGGAICSKCVPQSKVSHLSALSLEAMRRMLLLDFDDLKKLALPSKVRREIYDCIINYSEFYLNRSLRK